MTTQTTPAFITQALYDLDLSESKKRLDRQIKNERQMKEMFDQIRELLGDTATDEIISGGHNLTIDDMDCWQYQNYGFNSVVGYRCNDKPSFRFAVLRPEGERFYSITGWSIIDNQLDLAKVVKRATDEQQKVQAIKTELAAVDTRPSRMADEFEALAKRIRRKQKNPQDSLMIAILNYVQSASNDYDDYDDDDDDLPDEQD